MYIRFGIVGPGTSQNQWSQRQNSFASWLIAGNWLGANDCMTSAIWSLFTWCVRRRRSSLYDRTNPLLLTGLVAEGPALLLHNCTQTALKECGGPSLSCTANGAGWPTVNFGLLADSGCEGSSKFDRAALGPCRFSIFWPAD